MTEVSVSCDKCGATIHLSGETCPLDTPEAIDGAVIDIIMDLAEASSDAKDFLVKKQRGKTPV